MAELFTNFGISTLAAGIGAVDTSVQVQTGDGALFPSPTGSDFFRVVMIKKSTGEKEIAFCTARSTDTLTITRGQEGTTALALNADDRIENRPTAGFFSSLSLTSTEVQGNEFNYDADTGAADAYVATLSPVPAATGAGFRVDLLVSAENTGASTLNVNSLGATAIKRVDGTALMAGDLRAGELAQLMHDGTNWILLNPYNYLLGSDRPIYNAAGTAILTSADGRVYHTGNIETIPYNLSAAHADQASTLSTGSNMAGSIQFNDDGTKAYYNHDTGSGGIVELTLSTAWDITTGSQTATLAAGYSSDFCFSADGTRLYTVYLNTVSQFNLSTAWDLSTAAAGTTLDVSAKTSTGRGLWVTPDGARIYVVGATEQQIFGYAMSTALNLSTASYSTVVSVSWASSPGALRVHPDGERGWLQDGIMVREFIIPTANTLTTVYEAERPFIKSNVSGGFAFGDSGYKFYWAGGGLYEVESHAMRVIR